MRSTYGQVTSVHSTDGTVEVRVAGDLADTTVAKALTDYTATAGDDVILLSVARTWVILGAYGDAA